MRYFVCFIKPNLKIFSYFLVISLLNGVFFVPTDVNANFISNIFGTVAKASSPVVISDTKTQNSQNLALLETKGISLPEKEAPKDKKAATSPIDENSEVSIEDNALLPSTGPAGVADGGVEEDFSDVDVYVVRAGDNVASIAKMFGVSTDTIISVNDLKGAVKQGQVLLILPSSGVEIEVTKGQTLQGIAKTYKVEVEDILEANDLAPGAKLSIGDNLIIPGGTLASATTKPKAATSTTKKSYSSLPAVAGFVHPLPSGHKTQGLHGHNGVDYGAPVGTPIRAAASGTVLIARTGWNGGYGGLVVVAHSNGTQTYYAHMSRLGTTPGAHVDQGETIGYVGNTGKSTGPHLHFEVRNGRNPF